MKERWEENQQERKESAEFHKKLEEELKRIRREAYAEEALRLEDKRGRELAKESYKPRESKGAKALDFLSRLGTNIQESDLFGSDNEEQKEVKSYILIRS